MTLDEAPQAGTARTPVRVQRTGARRSRPGNGAALGRIRCAVCPGLSVCLPEGVTGSQWSNPGTQGTDDRTAVMSHPQMSPTPRRLVPKHQCCPDDLFVNQCLEGFLRVGLTLTQAGIRIEPGGRFDQLLRKNNIEIPQAPIPWSKAEQTRDKLYSCRCQQVWVRTATVFDATCSRRHAQFQPGNHVARKAARARTDAR